MVAVIDNSPTFLKYVIDLGVAIGSEIKVLSRIAYDNMLLIETNGKKASVSAKFSDNIYVICHDCIKGKSCKLNCKNF
jgi:DtxR family Mn-dependent transcriptional regulator